ncbi:MAG TPA: hypothetical protein VHW00_20035 [Thermoanaerobaculia bacterium]|nr:hypothetical protein [Thermoanaerobaculia bacterium]
MASYDSGHIETETALPEPLAANGIWALTTFALPSAQLSVASAAIYFVVFLFLQAGGRDQHLFVLPWPGAACVAAIAAALSWGIAARCRHRPGRVWPRVWALILAALTSLATILGVIFHERSWVLSLSVAGLAAAATLAPRLLKLRPDNALVQRIALLSMVVIAVLILPSACAARRAIAKQTEERVERRIQQLRIWTQEIDEIIAYDWARFEENPEAAKTMAARLANLHFKGSLEDLELWNSAATLGRDAELLSALQQLNDKVVAGFEPSRVPRVSTLREPAVRWDSVDRRWQSYSQFTPLSEVTGSYHKELGRLFSELGTKHSNVGNGNLVAYGRHYAENRRVVKEYLDRMSGTWADHWAAFKAPSELTGRDKPSLHDVLRAPFLSDMETRFTPGDLARVSSLSLERAKLLARGLPGCAGGAQLSAEARQARANGCRCVNFEERRREYYRLDCYSYGPAQEGLGAELRIEMRVVYESPYARALSLRTVPSEIYFHFLIPEGIPADQYRETVMTELLSAAGESSTHIATVDRGASATGGFDLDSVQGVLRVLRPSVVRLNGLTPEPEALLVRVVRASDRHEAPRS